MINIIQQFYQILLELQKRVCISEKEKLSELCVLYSQIIRKNITECTFEQFLDLFNNLPARVLSLIQIHRQLVVNSDFYVKLVDKNSVLQTISIKIRQKYTQPHQNLRSHGFTQISNSEHQMQIGEEQIQIYFKEQKYSYLNTTLQALRQIYSISPESFQNSKLGENIIANIFQNQEEPSKELFKAKYQEIKESKKKPLLIQVLTDLEKESKQHKVFRRTLTLVYINELKCSQCNSLNFNESKQTKIKEKIGGNLQTYHDLLDSKDNKIIFPKQYRCDRCLESTIHYKQRIYLNAPQLIIVCCTEQENEKKYPNFLEQDYKLYLGNSQYALYKVLGFGVQNNNYSTYIGKYNNEWIQLEWNSLLEQFDRSSSGQTDSSLEPIFFLLHHQSDI